MLFVKVLLITVSELFNTVVTVFVQFQILVRMAGKPPPKKPPKYTVEDILNKKKPPPQILDLNGIV